MYVKTTALITSLCISVVLYAQPYQRKIVPITLQTDQLEFVTDYLQHIVKRWPYTGQQGCFILNISNQPYRQKPARLSLEMYPFFSPEESLNRVPELMYYTVVNNRLIFITVQRLHNEMIPPKMELDATAKQLFKKWQYTPDGKPIDDGMLPFHVGWRLHYFTGGRPPIVDTLVY